MKNCGTCMYWEYTESRKLQGFGKCHGISMSWDATEWDQQTGCLVLTKENKHVKAFVEDGSDYYAALIPSKDFGCVMHVEGKYNE